MAYLHHGHEAHHKAKPTGEDETEPKGPTEHLRILLRYMIARHSSLRQMLAAPPVRSLLTTV